MITKKNYIILAVLVAVLILLYVGLLHLLGFIECLNGWQIFKLWFVTVVFSLVPAWVLLYVRKSQINDEANKGK